MENHHVPNMVTTNRKFLSARGLVRAHCRLKAFCSLARAEEAGFVPLRHLGVSISFGQFTWQTADGNYTQERNNGMELEWQV